MQDYSRTESKDSTAIQPRIKPVEQLPAKEQEEELFIGEKKFRSAFGVLAILFIILSIFTVGTTSQETGAAEIKNRVSTSIESGFTTETDVKIDSRDFEVSEFEGNGTARMLIWDFKGNTNNEVQILVDGKVIREVHVLNSNVAAYSVPVPSVVTIKGLTSNSGVPITYAVKFPEREQTLFNVVPSKGANQYTLVPRL
ncbi:hypothetical protein [Paenibacillus montanisoli]|uniref:Uncharacterized protein n=1 Tax=Paenibacillus montanisoli TaxID=2081970 RepID=A0A328U0I7_9BACL|nr:hypothetical protein [Paenibacillus montanisoli]RAP74365.1 hypothetical protein DL346_19990 [Paenibacillus montanisoli]